MKTLLNSRVVTTIVIILILIFAVQWGYNKYTNLQTDLRISQQNEASLNDSVRKTKNDLNQVEFSKQILVAKNKRDLKRLNKDMADKVSKLEGKISSLTSTIIELNGQIEDMDDIPTEVVDITPPDSNGVSIKAFSWDYEKRYDDDNFRAIAGKTTFEFDSINSTFKPLYTSITKDIIRFELTQGLRTTKDGKVEMFATSNYPNFEVKELNSVLIDPDNHPVLKKFTKEKRFSLGLYTGYGGTLNLSNSTVIMGPQFGVGVNWRIW